MENSNTKAMKSKISDEERCRHFLIKELNLSPIQANTLYDGYVKACLKYASQQSTPPVQDKPDFQQAAVDLMTEFKNGVTKIPGHDWRVPCVDHYGLKNALEKFWKNYVDKQPCYSRR
jgi:hypothetical protein